MKIEQSVAILGSIGFCLDQNFITSTQPIKRSPIVDQMIFLLEHLKDGVKLTKTGNLPTALVESFVKKYDQDELRFSPKRFSENDFLSIQIVKNVALTASLAKITKETIQLTKIGKSFLESLGAEQFIYLFAHYTSKHNIALYDGYNSGAFVQSFGLHLLNIIFYSNSPHTKKEYCDLLRKEYPILDQYIDEMINPRYMDTKEEMFEDIVDTRLFLRFFELFGLIKEENDLISPSELLKTIMPKRTNAHSKQLSSNTFKEIKSKFESIGYDIDLFDEFVINSGLLAHKYDIPYPELAKFAQERYGVKQEDLPQFLNIQTEYYQIVSNFYDYLLDDERKGDTNGQLVETMQNAATLFYHQLPKTLLPTVVFTKLESLMVPSFFSIFESYGVEVQKDKLFHSVKEKMGDFTYEKVVHFFQLLTHTKRNAQKSKRLTSELTEEFKLVIMNYIVVCWDILIYRD